MKKLLMVLGVIFICIVLVAVIGIAFVAYHGDKLDKSSKVYVDEVIPKVIASWNSQELISHASPELIKIAPRDKMDSMFRVFSERLGALKEYKGSEGDSLVSVTQAGKVITANYVARAVFEKAKAEIKVSLIQHNEEWQLLGFNVNSEALIPN